MNTNDTIYVTGHTGLVGSAIMRALSAQGFKNVWTATHRQLDLRSEADVYFFFDECKPDYVFHCAAMVGGIEENSKQHAEFLCNNLSITHNVLRAAHKFHTKKLLFMASAAVYPENISAPLSPEHLMCGPFDETKAGYAMAKLAGIQMCKAFRRQYDDNFISVIPNNVYGPGDTSNHVIPAMLRKFMIARRQSEVVTCWGTGKARREFIYADDLAEACLFLMDVYNGYDPVNVGVNRDWTMEELARIIAGVTDYDGPIKWDHTKPEGAPRRLLNSEVMNGFGWFAKTCLLDGLVKTYKSFV